MDSKAVCGCPRIFVSWFEADQEFELCAKEAGELKPMTEESDGLAGELYGSRGWISRFSKVMR